MKEINGVVAKVTMSSLEIAQLTGKEHKHVLRDIDSMIAEFQSPKMDSEENQGVKTVMAANGMRKEILLDKDFALCLVSGYSAVLRQRDCKPTVPLLLQ